MPREIFEAVRASRRDHLRAEIAAAWPAMPHRLVLEIGCGNGHFLAAYAAAHPDRPCAGLDLRLERIEKARRKCDRAGLRNLHLFRCDALDFLQELPAPVRLAEVFMLFPDPWPKKRHHKNRLLKTTLLDTLAARAGQGSLFFFRTDFKPYYDEALGLVEAHPAWQLLPPGPFPFEHPTIFQARADTFHSLGAVRRANANPVTNQ
jgi:tRNA (guanine-N7-)-methyltransferase